MTDSGEAPLLQRATQTMAAVTATATGTQDVRAPQAGIVTAVRYVPVAAVTGAASPASRTLAITNKGQSGTGSTAVASLALIGGVNLAAFDEADLALSGTAANLVVAEGDVLAITSSATTSATGLADPGGTYIVEIARD